MILAQSSAQLQLVVGNVVQCAVSIALHSQYIYILVWDTYLLFWPFIATSTIHRWVFKWQMVNCKWLNNIIVQSLRSIMVWTAVWLQIYYSGQVQLILRCKTDCLSPFCTINHSMKQTHFCTHPNLSLVCSDDRRCKHAVGVASNTICYLSIWQSYWNIDCSANSLQLLYITNLWPLYMITICTHHWVELCSIINVVTCCFTPGVASGNS